jgi:uncharacterized protein YndB with AHSA1/START domain
MILDLSFEEFFPQSIGEVWRAITDRQMLAAWLMDNDFEPRVGKRFTLRCPPGTVVECELLEFEPPHRMVWSWSDGAARPGPSRVSFELRNRDLGTLLSLRHTGESEDEQGGRLRGGWPTKFSKLRDALARDARRPSTGC